MVASLKMATTVYEREIGLAAPSELSLAAERDKRRLYLKVGLQYLQWFET